MAHLTMHDFTRLWAKTQSPGHCSVWTDDVLQD
jgi:hypothetical protein